MKTVIPLLISVLATVVFVGSAVGFVVSLVFLSQTLGGGGGENQLSGRQAAAFLAVTTLLLYKSVRSLGASSAPLRGLRRRKRTCMGDPGPHTRHYDLTGTLWGSCVTHAGHGKTHFRF